MPTETTRELPLRVQARTTPLTRHGVSGLCGAASVKELRAALHEALEARDPRAGTALGLALAASPRGKLEVDEVLRLLPDVEPGEHLAMLLAASKGDRLATMAKAISGGRLPPDSEAVVAFLAIDGFDLAPPPPDWSQVLRSLARSSLPQSSGGVLGSALLRAGDADAKAIGKVYLEDAALPEAKRTVEQLRAAWRGKILQTLPEVEPPRVVSGYTVQRSEEERIGRNDPCPCGSGKKYKKCHGAPGAPPLAGHGSAPAVDVKKVGVLDVSGMKPAELAQIDLAAIRTESLVEAFWVFYDHRRWEDIERVLELLSARSDLPKGTTVDTYREEMIAEALRIGQDEVAKRQIALVKDTAVLRGRVELATSCAWPVVESLSTLDTYARAAVKGDAAAGRDLAHALIDTWPGLGILVARGTLSPEQPGDATKMLTEIEHARDSLGLPTGDPAASAIAAWTRTEDVRGEARAAREVAERERDAAKQEALRARRDLATVRREVSGLEQSLAAARAEIARLEAEAADARVRAATAAAPGAEAEAAARALGEERRKLAARVDELKGLVAEGNRERAELRRRQAELEERVSAAPAGAGEGSRAGGAEADEGDEAGDDVAAPAVVLLPTFSRSFAAALEELPATVVRDAFDEVAALASGDQASWRRVKKLQRVEKVWSARVGIHYRLLFRIEARTLEVLEIVTRESLLKTIERYHR